MIDYSELNGKQNEAVQKTEGSVLVFAGAGSGKTRVLTYRIANIIEKGLARSYEILAITFTNKAANEMKDRLSRIVGDVRDMWICTIHSMCNRILRRDIDKLGYDPNFTIYTESEKDRLIKRIMSEKGIDDKLFKSFKWHIGSAKCEGISPDRYELMNVHAKNIGDIASVYATYESELMKANALDFDDLLLKTKLLLSCFEEVREKYSNRFKYIHIDEFQDTNNIQYDIVKLLYKNHGNLFAVGDDDQSIYAFRGANVKNILKYDEDFPNSTTIKLEQNYRSTKRILEIANAIISKNTIRQDKALWCELSEGAKVSFTSQAGESYEGQFVAETIKSLVSYSGYSYSDIAVLYRMNSLSRSFENEFVKYNVPYRVFGGQKFYDRKEIKDLTAYLRAIVNPKDNDAFMRIINLPKRGIGDTTVNKLLDYAKANNIYFYEALNEVENLKMFNAGTTDKLLGFRGLIAELSEKKEELDANSFVEFLIEKTSFLNQFIPKTEENISREQNVSEFVNSLVEFTKSNEDATIVEFLQSVALMSSLDDVGEQDNNLVTLATVHAVKGLEFKVVFVVGLEEGNFPILRSDTSFEDLEEERRLMYVAVTRAMERLFLTASESRYSFQTRARNYMMTSRFIKDIADLVGLKEKEPYEPSTKKEDIFFGGMTMAKKIPVYAEKAKPSVSSGKDFSVFTQGANVTHPKFGDGVIVALRGQGEEMQADVAFAGHGVKSLALKYAPLTLKGE